METLRRIGRVISGALGPYLYQLGAVLAGVLAMVGYHKFKVFSAGRKGRKEGERDAYHHVDTETRKQTDEMKERARETKEAHNDLDPDDVRRRMLEQASDRDPGS